MSFTVDKCLPWKLLDNIKTSNLSVLFPNLNAVLWVFSTIYATVANSQRFFSMLKLF